MEAQQENVDMEFKVDEMELKTDADEYSDAILEELAEIKKKIKELEEEAAFFTNLQTNSAKKVQNPATSLVTGEEISKQEADSRSVFVGNVDYSCTADAVHRHFQSCGTVNRVTILVEKFGQPKGYAYVEFSEGEAVQNALLLNQSELCNRLLKVTTKRTNIPRISGGKHFNPYLAYHPWGRPYARPYLYSSCPYNGHGIMAMGIGRSEVDSGTRPWDISRISESNQSNFAGLYFVSTVT